MPKTKSKPTLRQLTDAELTDTTAIRTALDAAGIEFPRGFRLAELQQAYQAALAGAGPATPDHRPGLDLGTTVPEE